MVSRNAVSTECSFGMQTHENLLPKINKTDLENDKSTQHTTFKALMYETSVYQYNVELKEDALTENGSFDLVKVPDLRLIGAKQLIRKIRTENHLSQSALAKILNVGRDTVNKWENNGYRVPLKLLVKCATIFGILKDTIYSQIEDGKFKATINLPIKLEKIQDIISYLSPQKGKDKARITLIKRSSDTLQRIKKLLDVNLKPKVKRINSRELHSFLTTFFRYTEVPKIHPPLTREVKRWYDDGVDLKRAVIIPCLQSDGSIVQGNRCSYISYSGKNKILHDYFVDAIYYEFNELPSWYLGDGSSEDCYTTGYTRQSTNKIVGEVINLAGNTKTSPAPGQMTEEYLKEPQPHLEYLINAPNTEKKIAFRLWASVEGSICLSTTAGLIYPLLAISCSHPELNTGLQEIAQQFNINFHKVSSKKSWSGDASLHANAIRSCIAFLELGGFIKGVQISKHSKYHYGINKDVLMLGIFEFIKRQRLNEKLRDLPRRKVRARINEIIKNKAYMSEVYYIRYFS